MRRLVATTDILIENYRPGVMRRFGLDYATLAPDHPALIYASISGYGQTGPDAPKGGFDLIAQGVSGLMSVTGEPGRPPVKVGVPLTDLGAALFALAAILAALHYRHRTGLGQHIDTSLVEAGIALSVWEATEYFGPGIPPEPLGSAHRMLAPYQAIRCADGYITLAAGTDRLFERLCTVLGHPEWTAEPAFANDTLRVRNRVTLIERIEAMTTQQPRAHWLARFDDASVPCGPINDYAADLRRSAGARTRDGRRRRTPDARSAADAGVADQDVGDAARDRPARAAPGRAHPRSAARDGVRRERDQRGDGRRRPCRLEPGRGISRWLRPAAANDGARRQPRDGSCCAAPMLSSGHSWSCRRGHCARAGRSWLEKTLGVDVKSR